MEPDKFILYSLRGQGWLTRGGMYSSDRREAKEFTHSEMVDQCRIHYKTGMHEFGLIPVSLLNLKDIAQ